jgi:hypothetical protein
MRSPVLCPAEASWIIDPVARRDPAPLVVVLVVACRSGSQLGGGGRSERSPHRRPGAAGARARRGRPRGRSRGSAGKRLSAGSRSEHRGHDLARGDDPDAASPPAADQDSAHAAESGAGEPHPLPVASLGRLDGVEHRGRPACPDPERNRVADRPSGVAHQDAGLPERQAPRYAQAPQCVLRRLGDEHRIQRGAEIADADRRGVGITWRVHADAERVMSVTARLQRLRAMLKPSTTAPPPPSPLPPLAPLAPAVDRGVAPAG